MRAFADLRFYLTHPSSTVPATRLASRRSASSNTTTPASSSPPSTSTLSSTASSWSAARPDHELRSVRDLLHSIRLGREPPALLHAQRAPDRARPASVEASDEAPHAGAFHAQAWPSARFARRVTPRRTIPAVASAAAARRPGLWCRSDLVRFRCSSGPRPVLPPPCVCFRDSEPYQP